MKVFVLLGVVCGTVLGDPQGSTRSLEDSNNVCSGSCGPIQECRYLSNKLLEARRGISDAIQVLRRSVCDNQNGQRSVCCPTSGGGPPLPRPRGPPLPRPLPLRPHPLPPRPQPPRMPPLPLSPRPLLARGPSSMRRFSSGKDSAKLGEEEYIPLVPVTRCKVGAVPFRDSQCRTFDLKDKPRNWDDSRLECEMQGGSLPKLDKVAKDVTDYVGNLSYTTPFWTGASYDDNAGSWSWPDGEPLSSTFPWEVPAGDFNNKCQVLKNGKYGADNCSKLAHHICEFDSGDACINHFKDPCSDVQLCCYNYKVWRCRPQLPRCYNYGKNGEHILSCCNSYGFGPGHHDSSSMDSNSTHTFF